MPVPRWASLVLISSQGVTNWGFRNALPSWLPLLAASLNLTDGQRSLLMSSFFPVITSPRTLKVRAPAHAKRLRVAC